MNRTTFFCAVFVSASIGTISMAGPLADYGDAPDPAYPSLFNSVGPYHVDKDREWLGPGVLSTTTTELDSKQIDSDNDDGAPYYLSGPGGNWIHATVSYNPNLSFATDNRYLNVLVDENNDGLWSTSRPEWLVRNYSVRMDTLPVGITTAEVFVELPAGADPAALANRTTRLTLSNSPVPNGSGAWGALTRGETEDYIPTDRGGNGGIGGTGSTLPVNPPIGGGPGIGPKTTSLTENGVGKWILKAPWDACSHGTGGARTPVAPAPAANLYDWQMNVPNNVTAGPFVTFAGAPGEPHAGESGLDIAFETPPAVIIEGQINTWTGWYRCGGAPCHDGRTATYSVTYDPDGIYFIVSNDNGVPYDPAYDAPSGTPSSGSDYGHDIAMFAIPAVPEPGTAGLVVVASMLALPRLRRRS